MECYMQKWKGAYNQRILNYQQYCYDRAKKIKNAQSYLIFKEHERKMKEYKEKYEIEFDDIDYFTQMEEALRFVKIKAKKFNYSMGDDADSQLYQECMINLSNDRKSLIIVNRKKIEKPITVV